MNLHGIAALAVAAVNPLIPVTIQVSTGPAAPSNTQISTVTENEDGSVTYENPDGSDTPGYATAQVVMAQVQALTSTEIEHTDALNITGVTRGLYVQGEVDGLVRGANRGGDLVTLPDGTVWLVKSILEHWPDWTKCAIVLQDRA